MCSVTVTFIGCILPVFLEIHVFTSLEIHVFTLLNYAKNFESIPNECTVNKQFPSLANHMHSD